MSVKVAVKLTVIVEVPGDEAIATDVFHEGYDAAMQRARTVAQMSLMPMPELRLIDVDANVVAPDGKLAQRPTLAPVETEAEFQQKTMYVFYQRLPNGDMEQILFEPESAKEFVRNNSTLLAELLKDMP